MGEFLKLRKGFWMAIERKIWISAVFVFFLSASHDSGAVVSVGKDIELEGFLKAQNILRTPKFKEAEAIMQRNTLQLESKYYFLREGQMFNKFNSGLLEEGTLTLVGRGVYDSIYEIRNSLDGEFSNANGKQGLYEANLREGYVDLALPPFSLRIGRQQVVWGETDGFRALDVINPLDLSWHWSREYWEDIRIPLWMVRGIYDIGKFSVFEESFFETVWIPADFRPNKIATDPKRPWAFTGAGLPEIPNSIFVDGILRDLEVEIRDLSPKRRLRNGQGGARFKAIWGDIDFSLNYFYGFSADTGVRVREDLSSTVGNTHTSVRELVNPRSHVVGLTANYSEERFTQSVFRMETTFTTGIPVKISPDAPSAIDPDGDQFDTARRTVVMLAVDRPTWIKFLNPTRTFYLSSQVFWRHYIDYSRFYRGIYSVEEAVVDGLPVRGKFFSENTDQLDKDEFVITFSASTSYGAAGLIKPSFIFAIDPRSTGAYNKLALDYFWSDNILLKFEQGFYWRAAGHDPGPWALGDIWGHTTRNSRHETSLSIVFQF